jgi:hypothetical protein
MEAVYTKGDVVELHADIYPAFIHPLPPGAPANGVRKRIVVTERCLSIGWSVSGYVNRLDIPMTKEQTANATLRGGSVGPYAFGQDRACSSCGSGAIKSYNFWPGVVLKTVPRADVATAALKADKTYGQPSGRYTRTRPQG